LIDLADVSVGDSLILKTAPASRAHHIRDTHRLQ